MTGQRYLCTPESVAPIESFSHQILYEGQLLSSRQLAERLGLNTATIQTRVRHYAEGFCTYAELVSKAKVKNKPTIDNTTFIQNKSGVVTAQNAKGLMFIALGDWIISKYDVSTIADVDLTTASSRIGKYRRGALDCDGLFAPLGFFHRGKPNRIFKRGAKNEVHGNAEWRALGDAVGDKQLKRLALIKTTPLDEKYGVGSVGKGAAYVSFNGEG